MPSNRYLIFVSVIALSITASHSKWIICDVPSHSVEVDNQKLLVEFAMIGVRYDKRDLAVYEYPDTNIVNVLINNTLVLYSGSGDEENRNYYYHESFISKISGSAQLTRNTQNYDTLSNCDFYISKTREEDGKGIPSSIQQDMFYQAESCIRKKLCRSLGKVTMDDLRNADVERKNIEKARNVDNFTPVVSLEEQLSLNVINRDGLQSTINMLVDLAIAEIVRKMREENQGRIKIPDIKHEIAEDSVWKPHGVFTASDGTFSDLTTLSRTENATLSHKDLKFIASCGFGLSKANINYENYKLKYSIMPSVHGHLSASIDGVAIATNVAVDYNQTPCKAILQDLRITKLGKINLKITGLGDLINKFMAKIVTWVTNKWEDEVVKEVEKIVRTVVAEHMASFNCEKYRP